MRTTIPPHLLQDPEVEASEKVLRACVHCGFCNATCPTYLLTGNELEGPRGRIYLIKSVLEEDVPPTRQTVEHIDNCLGCLACGDHLPERRGLLAPLGDGPTATRSARQAAIDGPPAARPC